MWRNILLVGAGSFVGGVLRYIVSLLIKYSGGFPWATFTVNLLGCLAIGLLWGLFSRYSNVSQQLVLFLSVGFCGGFTTFSTFSKESLQLIQSGNWMCLALYVAGSSVNPYNPFVSESITDSRYVSFGLTWRLSRTEMESQQSHGKKATPKGNRTPKK